MKKCLRCFQNYEENKTECPWCGFQENQQLKEPQYLSAGTVLQNRYEIGAVVGAGGFGITYAAWDRVLEQRVAIKEYMPGEFSTRAPGETRVSVYGGEKEEQYKNGRDKFYEESQRLAKFQDVPGIVQIYNSFEENETAYLVMEFLEGETLGERLKRDKRIPEQEAVGIILPVLQALTEVHRVGILHRDIAPNNIFLTKDGGVKLLDFGASRSVTGTHSKSLTVLYKEGYTPEEQYRSRGDQGTWTDVYEVAATLYKMLTGTVPPGALERRRKDTLKLPSKMGIKVTKQTEQALLNALNVDVRYRTKTADAFMQELMGTEKTKAHFVRTEEKKQGSIPLWIKGLVGTLLCGMGVYLVLLFTGVISGAGGFAHLGIPKKSARIPNLVNMNLEDAQKKAEESELKFLITDKNISEEIPEGYVLTQKLKAGSLTEKGETIEVGVSAGLNSLTAEEIEKEGIELVQIPDLQYQDMDSAIKMMQDVGIDVKVEFVKTGIVEGGKVTAQSVAAGEQLAKGESITLNVEDFIVDWTEADAVETAVRGVLGKDEGDVYASEMQKIDSLTVYLPEDSKTNVEVLENCLDIEDLTLFGGMSIPNIEVVDVKTEIEEIGKLAVLPKLKSLYFMYAKPDDWTEIKELVQLDRLQIYGVENIDFSGIAELKNLKQLNLLETGTTDISELTDLKNLTQLWVCNTNITEIPQNFPLENIEYLGVDENVFDKIENIEKLQNIKKLRLGRLEGTEKTAEMLKKLKNLEEIDINSVEDIYSIEFLKDLNQVQKLEINYIGKQKMEQNSNEKVLVSMKGLKEVTWYNAVGKEEYVKAMFEEIGAASQIEELSIRNYAGDTNIDLSCLENLKNLTELTISKCDSKKIKGMEKMQFVPKLIVGGLDENMLDVIADFSNLEELSISETDISDLSILKNNKKLRKITIGEKCRNLTMKGLKELNQLEEVYFYPDTDENKIEELRKLQDAG